MKHLKLFFALFAMLALGVGNAWAEETELFFQTYPGNPTKFTGAYNSSFSLTTNDYTLVYANVNNGQKNDNWSVIRSGSNKNASVATITSGKIEAAISKVMINFTQVVAKSTNSLYLEVSNNSSFTSATKITATIATGNIEFTIATPLANQYYRITIDQAKGSNNGFNRFDKIVFYQAVSSGGDEPVASLTANPTTIDFGTVYQGSTVANQTVTVNFENLTGVTYSGLTTPFTATGTISNDGDKITIAADASNIEEYSQTLTIAAADKSVDVIVKMNVVEKPAPTGTFTLHTGDLIEGDYVIVSTNSLKAEVNSERLASLPVTISNDEIVDPDATTIWHIAKSGEYWTLYNANKAKYAASTGAKNKAALLDAGTDDKALWSVTGTSKYEFVNKKNTANSVNANLRYNSGNAENSRWACYSTSTGAALSLYRKAGAKYDVTVNSTTNGTVTADPTSAEAGTTITLTVTPAGGYVLDALTVTDASSNPVTVTDNKFTMPASDVTVTATFKANEKPAATLTLSKNGVEETFPGSWKQDDVVTLPSITSDCVKEFVGWSANPTCNEAPEYAAGDSYTLAATAQTLYAVYATAGAGETLTITPSAVDNDAENDIHTFTIDAAGYSLTAKKNSGSSAPTINASAKDVRIYAKGTVTLTAPKALNTIVFNISTQGKKRLAPITASVGAIATQASGDATVTWTGDATEVTFTVGDNANYGSESDKAGQLCFGTITVTTAGSYSNYSTTCSAALANPTFSLAEGKYTEAKSVEIEYTEGTVYYTMDGTTPTSSSTQYTGAIALNDCGEHTIKAVAISADSQSEVVEATYTIKLPIESVSAADPYTEAEAIAVYDGGCYDNQDVYVKGTVKSATFSSTYGNYTITLTNGFQFYRFLQAAETKFTEDIIVPGDVLIACGKLSKYQTTYQLAEGCYLVERIPYEGEKTDISNTETTAYTVDQAFALIADVTSDLTKEVYVKGIVAVAPTSNPTDAGKMTYSISDNGANTGNVLKVYLGLGLEGAAFTSKDDVKQGDYVVAKGKLLDYSGTYELTDNQLVQHKKAATITIADITMEVGETKIIAATITPAAAETAVVYNIKENTDNAISLSGNTITADAVGTATITATIATAAEYMGKTVDFTVTVNPVSTKEKVVILAQYDGKWYALKGDKVDDKTIAALEVTYFDGKLYNVDDEEKALIEWERAVVDGNATFKNGENYLSAVNSANLTLSPNACDWVYEGGIYKIESSDRTFLYRAAANGFKNYDKDNAGTDDYSSLPVVTAPVYATGNVTYTRNVTNKYGTICLPYASASTTGAYFYQVVGQGTENGKPAVYLESVNTLEAGVPYIFEKTANTITVTCQGEAVAEAGSANGLVGNFTNEFIVPADNYILYNNAFIPADGTTNKVNAYRAYLNMNDVTGGAPVQMPGRRYIGMSVQGENEATGFDNIQLPNANSQKLIINGQLIIIRDGIKYNAQGQKL